ncbi:MAG: hypothetical protein IKR73_05515, partial [Oscillospiraceae bacterium]|nr:hypothetical protein [Oscillospiraceae bacterium]
MDLIKASKLTKNYIKWDWHIGKNVPFTEELTQFILTTPRSTYALAALESGHLCHIYWGRRTDDEDLTYLMRLGEDPYTPKMNTRDMGTFMDNTPFEYPVWGTGDY